MKSSIVFIFALSILAASGCRESGAGDGSSVGEPGPFVGDFPYGQRELLAGNDIETDLIVEQISSVAYRVSAVIVGGSVDWDFTDRVGTQKYHFTIGITPNADISIETSENINSQFELRVDELANIETGAEESDSPVGYEIVAWFPGWETIEAEERYEVEILIEFHEPRPWYLLTMYLVRDRFFSLAERQSGEIGDDSKRNVNGWLSEWENKDSIIPSLNLLENEMICGEGLHYEPLLKGCRGPEYRCERFECLDDLTGEKVRETIACELDERVREARMVCGCPEGFRPDSMTVVEFLEQANVNGLRCDELPVPLD